MDGQQIASSGSTGKDTDLVEAYMALRVGVDRLGPNSAQLERRELIAFLTFASERDGGMPTEEAVVEWLSNPAWAKATVARKFAVLRKFLRWCFHRGYLPSNPCALMRGPRQSRTVPKAAQRSDVGKLFAAAATHRQKIVISFMVQEGLRCVEIARLNWSDLDLQNRTAFITGKAGHQRIVPLSSGTLAVLQESLLRKGPVVRNARTGAESSASVVSQIVQRLAKKANVRHSAHVLRATAASDMLSNGHAVSDVQKILGHARLSTTARYLRAGFDDMRLAVEGRTYV